MLKISEILQCLENNQKKFEIFNLKDIDYKIHEIKTDSRQISKNDSFLALKGENFDGHDFILNALKSGASVVFFELEKLSKIQDLIQGYDQVIFIGFADLSSVSFYGLLANFYRQNYLSHVKIIGITGSVGKTTLKNFLGYCLAFIKPGKVYVSFGNFNNFIGVPYNLFKIPLKAEFAVLELGMNAPGEISYLSKIINPDCVIINNISPSHIGNFTDSHEDDNNQNIKKLFENSLKKIAFAKAEIFDGLKENGLIILHSDLPFFEKILEKAKEKTNKIKTYDFKKNSDSDLFLIKNNDDSLEIMIKEKNQIKISISENISDNLIKAFLASTTFFEFSGLFDESQKSKYYENCLKNFSLDLDGRGALKITKNEFYFIDETYNAGFDSVIASIENLKNFQNPNIYFKRKIFIFGGMGELGIFSDFLHKELGKHFIKADFDLIILIGEQTKSLYEKFIKQNEVLFFDNKDSLLRNSENLIFPKDLILIKGQNSLQLWKIIDFFHNK